MTIPWQTARNSAALVLALTISAFANAGDSLQVDPGHHKTEFETPHFRVDRAVFGPGESSPDFFDAEAVVIVALTPMHMRLHFPDGSTAEPPPTPAGAALWAPAGKFRPENRLSERVEFVVIVPKGGGTRKGADPLAVDGQHYKLAFENDAVRVLRVSMEPKGKSVMHGHPEHVAVLLTSGKTLMTLPGGVSFVSVHKAGAVVKAPAGEHLPQNLVDEVTEVIVVEAK